MPFSPEEGNRRAIPVVEIVRRAEEHVNAQVARALARGAEPSTWALQKQAELGRLIQTIETQMRAMTAQTQVAVNEAVSRAHSDGSSAALRDLQAANIAGVLPQARALALLAISDEIQGKIVAGADAVLRRVPDVYRQVVGETVAQMSLGAVTRRQATQMAVDRFAAEGVTSFVDAAGRTWNLGSYAEMATRTGTARAAVDGHLRTLAANGNDLVYIIPGPRACPICDDWAGKVLSISGLSAGHSTMVQARAAGWGHPNCRCATGIYIEGITDPSPHRPSDSGFEAAQRQRDIERTIRKYKTRSTMAQTPQAKREADDKVRQWQAQMRAHLEAHPDLKRLPYREHVSSPTGRPRTPASVRPPTSRSSGPSSMSSAALQQRITAAGGPDAIRDLHPLAGGNTNAVMGGVLPDGTRVVVRNAWDRANVDAEQISHAIAARLGANVPALVRTGPNQTVQVMLSGQSAEDNESAWHLAARRHPEQVRDLAILDEITYNTDRHLANVWIDEEGNIFGIDQANRLPRRVRPTYTPFGEFLDVFQEVPMTLAEVDRALVALADVRELAESLGRAREWEAMRERIQKRRDLVVG